MVSLPTRQELFIDMIVKEDEMRPTQVSSLPISATQAATMPMQVSAAQTNGIDITNLMNLMIPMMIVMMMMGMMSKAMSSA